MLRFVLVVPLIVLALAPLTAGQSDAQPQPDYMVHFDTSGATPSYIPGTASPIRILPGGLLQFMLFGQGPRHSLSLDGMPAYDADVPEGVQTGFYERSAAFHAPQAPGRYPFHDKYDASAHGVLLVQAAGGASNAENDSVPTIGVGDGYDTHFYPARIEVAPGATVRFTNNASEIIHTLTADGGAFDLDAVQHGASRTFSAPTTPGEYPFHCKYHESAGMRGVLVVVASAQGATPASTKATPLPGVAWVAGILVIVAVLARRRRS